MRINKSVILIVVMLLAALAAFSALAKVGIKLTVDPKSVDAGQKVTIKVENVGDVQLIYTLEVTRPDGGKDTLATNRALPVGATHSFSYATKEKLEGTYKVRVTFDSSTVEDTFNARAVPPPRFIVDSISVDRSSICAGECIRIVITVKNTGGSSGTANLELLIDGSLRRSWSLSLAPGESTTVSESVCFSSSGSFRIVVKTQHDSASTSISVRPAVFFSVGPLSAPSSVKPNESFTVSATITNTGCGSGTQTILFLIDGSKRDSTRVSLSAGRSTTVSFRWSFSSKGTYRVTIESDDDSSSTTIRVNGTRDPEEEGGSSIGLVLPPIVGVQNTEPLQQLIEAAEPGETLVLPAGIYQGSLRIEGKQGLTLDGAGAVILIGNGRNPAIAIYDSQQITISGFTIMRAYPAIWAWESSEITISGNTLTHNLGPGIDSRGSTIVITENTIRENEGWGIVIRWGSRALIASNRLTRNRSVGIIVFGIGGETEVEIRDNQILETKLSPNGQWGRGIEIQDAKATIVNNLIQGHPDAGVITFGSVVELAGNTITATRGFYGRGVELQDSQAVLVRNTITNNEDIGLAVFASQVRLRDNVIRDNGYDLFADEHSTIEREGS